MIVVRRWTGHEARLLREAMRMSVRDFAAHLGYNDAAVSNWERRGTLAKLRTQTQRDLDTALKLVSDDTQERFSAMVSGMNSRSGSETAGSPKVLVDGDMSPLMTVPASSGGLATSGDEVGAYVQITACHRQLYWSGRGPLLLDAANSHTQLGLDLMGRARGRDRTVVGIALAESALLAGRLALFDMSWLPVATTWLEVALTTAYEIEDHALVVATLGHLAFAHAFASNSGAARSTLSGARARIRRGGVCAGVRSWLHCVESEVEARAGAGAACQRQVELAQRTLALDESAPPWFDFFNEARLNCFAGSAALTVGDTDRAARHLSRALEGLEVAATKQRGVILADLAASHLPDRDQAAQHLHEALDALQSHPYATGFARVRTVRSKLNGSASTHDLDERIEAIVADGGLLLVAC